MLVRMMMLLKYDNLDDNDNATTRVAPAVYSHTHALTHSLSSDSLYAIQFPWELCKVGIASIPSMYK